MAMNTSNRRTLNEEIIRENRAAHDKRWCAKCSKHVYDQHKTRSKYCYDCRDSRHK